MPPRESFVCVGGSLHGKRQVTYGRELRVPVQATSFRASYGFPVEAYMKIETYVVRPVGFGNAARVNVLALDTLSEQGLMLACASLFESIGVSNDRP